MSSLGYAGKNSPTLGKQVVNRRGVDTALSTGITRATVDQKVDDAVASLARTDYVDAQDANLATPGYVTQQDGLLVPLSQRGAANGVATLDSSSKVPFSQMPLGMGKGKIKGPYAATTRNAGFASPANNGTDSSHYVKVGSFEYPAPGFVWRPMVFISAIAASFNSTDRTIAGGRPDIEVRHGTAWNGTLCASGRGHNSIRGFNGINVLPNTDLTPQSGASYSGWGASTAVNLTIWLYGYFGGNTVELAGNGTYLYNCCLYLVEMGSNA